MSQRIGTVIAALVLFAGLAGCDSREAPSGKWQGVLFDGKWLVTVRLEITEGNLVRVSAPNLQADFRAMTADERTKAWTAIKSTLERQFSEATSGHVRMEGREIIRAEGFAPMFSLDDRNGQMLFYFYGDGSLTHHIPLQPVGVFSELKRPPGL
jgi:hypothetical protein